MALAHVKMKQLAFDDEFAHAFAAGHQNGPWRRYVQYPLAEIGIISWPSLSASQRFQARENFARVLALGFDAKAVIMLAKKAGLQRELCQDLHTVSNRSKQFCNFKN